jgi:hypothetical protein
MNQTKKERCGGCKFFLPAEIIEGFEFDDFCFLTCITNPKKCNYYQPKILELTPSNTKKNERNMFYRRNV